MFNWFQKAAGAVGNLFNQGSRYVGNTFNNADRQRRIWEQQARQAVPQVQRQVQQQVKQLPKPPQVDFSAVIKNLQALRNQPQVNNAIRAANPINQFQSQARAINQGIVKPVNQFGQNQVMKQYGLNQQQLADLKNKSVVDRIKFGVTRPAQLNIQNPAQAIMGSPLNPLGGQAAFQVFNQSPVNLPKPDLTKMADDASASIARSRVGKNPIVGFAGENIVRPIVKSGARYADVTTGQEKYQPGLKGVSQLGTDVFNVGSTVYTPLRAGKLAQGGKVALKAAPGAFARGAVAGGGISALNQYSDTGKIDPANTALSALLGGTGNVVLPAALGGLGRTGTKALAGLRKSDVPPGKSYTGNLLDEMNTKFRQGKIDEKQFRAFVVDDFTKKNGRMPMPADVDSFVDVATGRMNRPYVEALRQKYAGNQAQLPVGRRIADTAPKDPLESLKQEARKYKSAEEFVKAQRKKVYTTDTVDIDPERAAFLKSRGYEAIKDWTSGESIDLEDIATGRVKTSQGYTMTHRPNEDGSRAFDLTESGDIPKDMYDNWYGSRGTEADLESITALKKIRGNPEAEVTIYRASPSSEYNPGDWVTFSKKYAQQHAESNGGGKMQVHAKKVKAKDVRWAQDDINEFGYYPDGYKASKPEKRVSQKAMVLDDRQQLTDLYNQAKNKPIYELAPKPDAQVPVKASGISKSLQKSGSEIYADIPGYIPVKNKALLNISENRVANDERAVIDSIVNRQPNQPITPQMNADSVYLLNKLLKEGRDEEALAIAKATAKNATSAGRAVQILSQLQQTTPEGALVKAQKVVNEVNAKAKRQIATLDAKKQEDIIALANEVQKYKPDTRDWQVAAGKLAKYIENLKPVTKGSKVSMVQTMAQLLNPKTAIRNIVGNVGMSGGEDIASIPATLLDKIVSKKTGIRTTAISNPIVGIKGAIKGAKYGIEDTKLGIKTLGGQSKFDVRPDVFKKGVMKKLQNALGYELGVPDKAFYQSAFDKTLDSTMRANKTKTPTAEMLDIANAEALYATFQNNSAIGNALQKTKGVLNLGKDFGAGDFIIKYPKTPGNIVSVGLDYSPVGMAKGITSLARNLSSMTPAVQREAVRNIGRGITGTGAIAMGVVLAQNGIITGRKDSDKDIAALDREQGMGPFSFNATALQRFVRGEDTKARPGDVVANYDWLQPAAIQLSMGANAVINAGKTTDIQLGDLAESIGDSVNTIVEQPVLQGVSQFVNNLNTKQGGGLGKALSGVVSGIPSSFVPGSVNQIGQFMDNTARSTYSPKTLLGLPVGEMWNKTQARLPVLRESLQPAITTLGQPREQYQDGSNNIFNVFFNPAFIKTIKDNEVYELVKGIQDRSGETQQAPRVPDKKIKVNGQDKELTSEEYTRYQTYVGQKTNEAFSKLANDPRFNALSDTDKAKYMSGKLTDINAAAKSELFGNESTAGADRIKTGELGYETADDRKAKKPKTTKAKKPKKGRTAKAKKGRKAKVAKLPSIRLSAPRKVALAKVAKLRSPKVKYPRLAKSNKTPKIKV